MSSNCPPQLHLELPPNTTSFKRSFDQFGFDLESPLGAADGAGASTSDGNDRNKRARSASSFSDDDRSIGSSSSSTLASSSSPISGEAIHRSSIGSHISTAQRLGAPRISLNIGRSSLEPPRLPTPEIQDIDMIDYPLPETEVAEEDPVIPQPSASVEVAASRAEESYRLSLERFNAFDTQISALRRSRSPSMPRSPTPPPVLPPLELLGEEAPMNTNTISFLHPPAQPSPPLPHSLYSYGPPRNQRPVSRNASRNEPHPLDDPRLLPHELHTISQTSAESPTASRDPSDDAHTDDDWNPGATQNVGSAGTPWPFWPPASAEAGGDDDEESDEVEEEEVQEVLEQPSSSGVWSSPIPPTLGDLRSPSPFFSHLDDLDSPPPPTARRVHEHTAPPTLPPIEDQVLSPTWDPIEEVLNTVWSRNDSREQSQPPRISIPADFPRLRERPSSEDGHSANATMGSSSSDGATALPSPFTGWLDHDDPWFIRSPEDDEIGSSTVVSRNPTNNVSGNATTGNSSTTANSSTSSPSILDTYAASRLQALQGIGTALEGIGQALRDSELTLGSYLRDGSSASSVATEGGSISQGTTRRSPSARNSLEGRTSAWRSTSTTAASSEGTPAQRLLRLNAPTIPPPLELRPYLEDFDIEWPIPEDPPEPTMDEGPPESDTDDFRSILARYSSPSRRARSPASLDLYRTRTAAIEAAVRDVDQQLWPGSDDGDEPVQTGARHNGTPVPLSAWRARRRGRDRELPTNASMLFHDGPSPSSGFSAITGRPPSPNLRTVDPAVTRLRDTDRSLERETERERERERDRERREREREAVRHRLRMGSSRGPPLPLPSTLSQLRSRPYVGHSSTHAFGHSSLSTSNTPSPGGFAESAADAQRRIARLGLIQMQRQRSAAERTSSAEPPSSSRRLPPVPSSFEAFQSLRASPEAGRPSTRESMAEPRAQLRARMFSNRMDRSRVRDRAPSPSPPLSGMDTTANLFDTAMDTMDLYSSGPSLINTPARETSPERPHPAPRPVPRLLDRITGEPTASTSVSTASGPGPGSSNVFARTAMNRLSRLRPTREPPREFLPVPSLPSPDLEFEFASAADASEHHDDHRGSSAIRPGPIPVSIRRSPSPGHRRPPPMPASRRSPPSTIREFDPESFAPGPFRNTIQSFWSSRIRNNRGGQSSSTQPPPRVTPPSLPPLAFEEEYRPLSSQRPGDTSSLYRNGLSETSTPNLHAFLNRHPLPPTEPPQNPQRLDDFLIQSGSPLDMLGSMFASESNTTEPSSTDGISTDSNPFSNAPRWYYDGDDAMTGRSPRPPWRASHPPRVPPPEPPTTSSDLHNFLMRHPRYEAARRETSRRPVPSRGDEDGFNHAIDVLRQDGLSSGRSQDLMDTYHREHQRRLSRPSPWGIMEEGPGNNTARHAETGTSSQAEQPDGRLPTANIGFPRRRRSVYLDFDEEETDTGSPFERNRVLTAQARRFRGPGSETPVFPRRNGMFARLGGGMRRGRPLGDYMRDEDFNGDYEALLSLAAQLGDAKPRSTPDDVIAGLDTGLYKDWKTPDSDSRCPICLDDYTPDDSLLKLADCSHWLHRECLQQWLKGASTCPVCRKAVGAHAHTHTSSDPSSEAGPSTSRRRGPWDGPGGGGSGGGTGGGGAGGAGPELPRDPRRRRF
ncbi:hypothetical protein DXG01_005382 [Tephrocybe rancida]|nr:hypothetical protein DXG01_005382 [Tephrocybe rancida]